VKDGGAVVAHGEERTAVGGSAWCGRVWVEGFNVEVRMMRLVLILQPDTAYIWARAGLPRRLTSEFPNLTK